MIQLTKLLCISVPIIAALIVISPLSAANEKEFLHLKGYAEYFSTALNPTATFNYAGLPVSAQLSGTGSARVLFEGLADLTYEPTIQVTPRQTSAGPDTCSGELEVNGTYLIATVTCRKAGQLVEPRFNLMILDRTSDAAYAAVPGCGTCNPVGASHNPWSRLDEEHLMRIERPAVGRTRVYFRVDAPLTFDFSPAPMVFVTPAVNNHKCQVFSTFSGGGEVGAEVHCTNLTGVAAWAPFYLLTVPQTHETGWAQVQATGNLTANRFYNSEFGAFASGIEVERKDLGRYRVRFRGLGNKWLDGGAVQLSSFGSGGVSCALESTQISAGDHLTDMRCKSPDGSFIDSAFTVLVSSRN